MLYQRRHGYQALRRYERSNVARYCTILYGISSHEPPSRLCPSLANTAPSYIYSFWLISLACEVTAPLVRAVLLIGAREVRVTWSSESNRRQENSYRELWNPLTAKREIMKMSEKQRILF